MDVFLRVSPLMNELLGGVGGWVGGWEDGTYLGMMERRSPSPTTWGSSPWLLTEEVKMSLFTAQTCGKVGEWVGG